MIEEDVYTVTPKELRWLMHGLQIEEMKRYENLKSEYYPQLKCT